VTTTSQRLLFVLHWISFLAVWGSLPLTLLVPYDDWEWELLGGSFTSLGFGLSLWLILWISTGAARKPWQTPAL
jgi:hypothetical protein